MQHDDAPREIKKSAVLLIDGGYLRALLTDAQNKKKAAAQMGKEQSVFAPHLCAENIRKIALACVKPGEESLRRIFYYDCEEFNGKLAQDHPYFGRPCLHYSDAELQERRDRGSKFYLLNPRPGRDLPGDSERALVWRYSGYVGRILRDLEGMDLFAVRLGRLRFDCWRENDGGAPEKKFTPTFQQKGVDIKIGLDIASISLNRHAERIILLAGDTDFVPAMKFCRRQGAQLALAQLPASRLSAKLRSHCDFCRDIKWPGDAQQYQPGRRK